MPEGGEQSDEQSPRCLITEDSVNRRSGDPVYALGLSPWYPRGAGRVLAALGLSHLWIIGRRAGQVFEVAAYSGDWRWLRFLWLPAFTKALTLASSAVVIASLGRISPHFKGPRPPASRR